MTLYYKKQISYILAAALFAVPALTFAESNTTSTLALTNSTSSTATEDIDTLRAQLNALLNPKDEMGFISNEEKNARELKLRHKILIGSIALSYIEIDQLANRLNALVELNAKEQEKKEAYLEKLVGYLNYHDVIREKVNNLSNETLNVENIKTAAKELLDWRRDFYISPMKEMSAFILTIKQPAVLKISLERHEKIASDLRKLSQGGYINQEQLFELTQLLNKARELLSEAQAMNNDAYNVLFTEENKTGLDELARSSLENIKSAYAIFMEMSVKVKQILSI